MNHPKDRVERRNQLIAALLWHGAWCASALIAAGMILGMKQASASWLGLGLSGYSLVKAGVALFILLPIARVALMLTIFLRERDYVYALISALVLSIIGLGIGIQLRSPKATLAKPPRVKAVPPPAAQHSNASHDSPDARSTPAYTPPGLPRPI